MGTWPHDDLPLQDLADRLGLGAVQGGSAERMSRGNDLIVAFEAGRTAEDLAKYVLTVRELHRPAVQRFGDIANEARFTRSAADAGVPIAAPLPDVRTGRLVHRVKIREQTRIGIVCDFVKGKLFDELLYFDERSAFLAGTALGKLHDYIARSAGPVSATRWPYSEHFNPFKLSTESVRKDQRLVGLHREMWAAADSVMHDEGRLPLYVMPVDLPLNTIFGPSEARFIDPGTFGFRHFGVETSEYWKLSTDLRGGSDIAAATQFVEAYAEAGGDVQQLRRGMVVQQMLSCVQDFDDAFQVYEPDDEPYERELERLSVWAANPREIVHDHLSILEQAHTWCRRTTSRRVAGNTRPEVHRPPAEEIVVDGPEGPSVESELSSDLVAPPMGEVESSYPPEVTDGDALALSDAVASGERTRELPEAVAPTLEEIAQIQRIQNLGGDGLRHRGRGPGHSL